MRTKIIFILFFISLTNECIFSRSLKLPNCISSHMVVQRDIPLTFWGWGTSGDSLLFEFTKGLECFSDTTLVNNIGKWKVSLPAQSACTNACSLKITVLQDTTVSKTISDILIGDVWFAGGQSNMEKRVNHLLEAEQYIADANNFPLIRAIRCGYNAHNTPQDNTTGNPWFVCDSSEIINVSAVAYVFGRQLQETLQIPIGIMSSYRGGTELETWLSQEKIQNDPELCKVAGRMSTMDNTKTANYPSINFNGQVYPLIQYPIKGFIWYQGESNTKRALEYRFMQKKLIEDWRTMWNLGDIPFYYVQMYNIGPSSNGIYEEGNWQDIREQQALLLSDKEISNIGMAVSIDTNEDPNNSDATIRMHPHNKKPIGERLAALALKNTYGNDIVAESPIMQSFYFKGDTVYIIMTHVGNGLCIQNDATELKGFVIADINKNFKSATAKIINDSTICIYNNEITKPYAVRYAWAKNPQCNLCNSAGLPASPFRTDIWPSEYTYSAFTSSCNNNNDTRLLTICINGKEIDNFSAETEDYYIKTLSDYITNPQVTAYANYPFTQIKIEQIKNLIGSETDRTATISATAEDGTLKIYRIIFSINTDIKDYHNKNVKIETRKNDIHICNNANQDGEIFIYNESGSTVTNCIIKAYQKKILPITINGLYLAHFISKECSIIQKCLIQ